MHQATSNSPAAPIPPPMHMVTDHVLRAPALALDEGVADHARARHAVRVADGDGAAVHVEPVIGDAQLVAAVHHLHREGLVQLPQVDVWSSLQADALEEARHREHGTDAHLVRLAGGHREAAEEAERLEIALLGELAHP